MHENNESVGNTLILSFPDRGPWGDQRYPGNCSGYLYKTLFEHLKPHVFTDPMVGSGTSVAVAREMGIKAHGLDLHSGFNILKHSILEAVSKPSDLVLSHPPYKVKYQALDEEQQQARKQAIADVIVKLMKRMKEEK